MTIRRSIVHLSLTAPVATSNAVALPQSARGETLQAHGRTIKARVNRDLQAFVAG